jgi:beta-glucosidase
MIRIPFSRIFPAAFMLISITAQCQNNPPQLGKDPIPSVIKAMTLEEKAKFVVGKGLNISGVFKATTDDSPDRIEGISGHTVAIPRLGIPSLQLSDGPAGIHRLFSNTDSAHTLYSTAWPIGTLLASSWDTTLVKKVGVAFGEEIKEYGIDFILGPGLNIHRNPLGGRNFEYYSEDPLITGVTAAALINGIQSNGVGATPKHFAANNQETDRSSVNEIISERALREIYLKGFEIMVKKSQPWAIMSSYNYINGTYTSESYDLLTNILRRDWGFKGFVMTDWFGGKDAVAQMKAGNNMLMPGSKDQIAKIIEAVKNGQLSESVLDDNIAGILNIMLLTPSFKGDSYSNHPDLVKNAQVSRVAAAESMVLLKNNDNTLPLSSSKTVALFGNHAFDLIAGGTGSGDVTKAYKISLNEGLTKAGFKLDKDAEQAYMAYLNDYNTKHPKKAVIQELMNPTPLAPEYAWDKNSIAQKAASSDIAVICIGRNAGEGNDRKVADDYELTSLEKDMISNVSDAFHTLHKKVVVVLNIAGVINVVPWRDQVDAILLAWQPGQEGGNAITDIIRGKYNPSGKLASSFPVSYNDVPSAKNFPGKEFPEKATNGMFGKSIPAEVTYEEGIYVGYRYYNTFNVRTAYEFGYGLSYTKFSYGPVKLSSPTFNSRITATVTVTNTGNVAGKEVVELYLSAPRGKLDKPAEELKGFAKTALLQPGKSETISITLSPEDLASFDSNSSSWVAASGKYTIKIGASSSDLKGTASFNLPKDVIVSKVHKALAPQVQINELKK